MNQISVESFVILTVLYYIELASNGVEGIS